MLRPYISPKNYWILTHHEIFQAYYYGDAMKIDKNTRDRFKDQPYFGACEGENYREETFSIPFLLKLYLPNTYT